MKIYQELLPESYLLILADDPDPTDVARLSYALRRASRSGRPSIWVDCSQLPQLPLASLRVLLRFYQRLRPRHIPLVLCHLDGQAHQRLARLPSDTRPPIMASLLDAEHYCRHLHRKGS